LRSVPFYFISIRLKEKRMGRILSFRPLIEKLTHEYAQNYSDPELISHLLGELLVGISGYREEGAKNVPLVFFAPSLNELLVSLKGNDPVEIGAGPMQAITIRTILKTCGPLGQNHEWAIFICPREAELNYGIFRTDRFPLHESSFQRLRTNLEPNLSIIGIQKIGENIVEIRNSNGLFNYIDSSGLLELSQNPAHMILQWVSAVTYDVPANLKKKMEAFYHRIATEILATTHGCLLAVSRAEKPYPGFLSDGVLLQQNFGLSVAIRRYLKNRDEASTQSLTSYGNLIRKMMGMDGITVFNSAGDVLSYNCFARELQLHHPSKIILGGARKRAFEVLCSHLDQDLICALYQSQDGYGQCRTSKELKLPL
jgi:hypothetical protein